MSPRLSRSTGSFDQATHRTSAEQSFSLDERLQPTVDSLKELRLEVQKTNSQLQLCRALIIVTAVLAALGLLATSAGSASAHLPPSLVLLV